MKRIAIAFFVFILLAVILIGFHKNVGPDANSAAQTSGGAVSKAESLAKLDEYLASVKEKSDVLKTSLQNDVLTQTDMNLKAKELQELWDSSSAHVLAEAKNLLSADEWTTLTNDQNTWTTAKEQAAAAAGKEFEGGSLYALTVCMESARITEERVYELRNLLK